jgi:hypothetical protein
LGRTHRSEGGTRDTRLVRRLARLQPIGDREPLLADPVNWWAGTLLLVVALDLSRQHATDLGKSRRQ